MTLRDRIRCLRAVLRDIDRKCADGVLICPGCSYEDPMSDLDIRLDIKAALRADDRAEQRQRRLRVVREGE